MMREEFYRYAMLFNEPFGMHGAPLALARMKCSNCEFERAQPFEHPHFNSDELYSHFDYHRCKDYRNV